MHTEELHSLMFIECEESGYNAGFIHGKQLKTQIHDFLEFAENNVFLANKKAFFDLSRNLFLPHIPKIYQEEMQGIADGAEIDVTFILTINVFDDIMALLACSSIGILKNKTSNVFYHARNLDYSLAYLAGKTVLINYKKIGLVCIGFPGYIGGITSTNTSGLAISSQTLPQTDNYKTEGIPSGILYRMTTENAKSIDEALETLAHSKRATCHNLLISSEKENKMLVAEFYPNKIITRSANNRGIIATNHYVTSDLEHFGFIIEMIHLTFRKIKQIAGKVRYHLYNLNIQRAEKNLKEFIKETCLNSAARFQKLDYFLKNKKNVQLNDIKHILHTVSQQGPSSFTVQSVIFVPSKREIHLATKKSPPVTGEDYYIYNY